MITIQTIPEQLTEIYFKEPWHKTRMPYEEALNYHTKAYNDGNIRIYEENGEVLGYYERYCLFNACFLHNVYVKEDYRRGRVFKILCRDFFDTLPKTITKIIGEKVKLGGKVFEAKIRR